MKRSKGIAVGVAVAATAASAWFGCSSSSSPNNGSSSSSSGGSATGTNMSASSSTGSGSGTNTSASSSTGSGSGSSDAGADTGTTPMSFATDIYPAITANCVVCHHAAGDPMPNDAGIYDASGGGFSLGKLDMSTVDAAYANLIDQDAQGTGVPGVINLPFEDGGAIACDQLDAATPGHIRVVPGQAAQSLLCLKLKGWLNDGSTLPPCGDPMPLLAPIAEGGVPPGGQQAAFTAVQEWINGGANP
jgi:hypothetical protein